MSKEKKERPVIDPPFVFLEEECYYNYVHEHETLASKVVQEAICSIVLHEKITCS